MPGVIMENGIHSNHDRDLLPNGANGADQSNDLSWKQLTQSQSRTPQQNGKLGSEGHASQARVGQLKETTSKMPPEITHIDEGFEQLPKLLTRLAQLTHNEVTAKIEEMSQMPLPTPIPGQDDLSKENLDKKVQWMKFLEKQHESWTKALVITNWSRVSEDIGKLIDLQAHITERRFHYDMAFHEISELKRGLVHAKVPNPDFKTAVEVLSTGKASWMPDLGYIEPPKLTAKELLRSLRNLNTLLSERLNLHDYDKIPYQFRNYKIRDGRVTFTVEDEFEVDLTIADEDPEKQFWFIDFRFLFKPAVPQLKDHIRYALETEVNAAIEKDGLPGCYSVLHEMTLTHKLSELRRQAHELARGRWIDTLQVEALHRGVSIQYWKNRYGDNGPKSWIMLGPVSGKRKDGHVDEKTTSRIGIRWFRDGKEVLDAKISLNMSYLSAEELIRSVIGLHVGHILRSMKNNLKSKPLFSGKELAVKLRKSKAANGEPELVLQLTRQSTITILIEHITGKFAIKPASSMVLNTESLLNSRTKDPAANGHDFITNLHSGMLVRETRATALTVGWELANPRLQQDEVKTFIPKGTLQMWFRMPGWTPNWFLALGSGIGGESWWLVSVIHAAKENATGIAGLDGPKVQYHIQVPTKSTSLLPTYGFLSEMQVFTSSIICYHANTLALHQRKAKYALACTPKKRIKRSRVADAKKPESAEADAMSEGPTIDATEEVRQKLRTLKHRSALRLPNLYIPLSTLLPRKAWAKDTIQISFLRLKRKAEAWPASKAGRPGYGLFSPSQTQQSHPTPTSQSNMFGEDPINKERGPRPTFEAVLVAKGTVLSSLPAGLLGEQAVDEGIAFNTATNSFAFRLQSKVGEPIIEQLVQQLQRVSRLVDMVQVMAKHKDNVHCESVSLNRLVFTYHYTTAALNNEGAELKKERAVIEFSNEAADGTPGPTKLILDDGNPHIRTLDHLTHILNTGDYGLEALAINLSTTLPVVRALDAAENHWSHLGLQSGSELIILARASDEFVLKYSCTIPATRPDQKPQYKSYKLEIVQKRRGGETWWWIRPAFDPKGKPSTRSEDGFDKILKEEVWLKTHTPDQKKCVWIGQTTGAIAKVSGAEVMINAVNACMIQIAKNPAKYLGKDDPALGIKNVGVPSQQDTAPTAPVAQMGTTAQPPAQPKQNQPQQPTNSLNRASTMQLKLPAAKRPQPQTANTVTPKPTQAFGPSQAISVQRNPTVPVANMRGANAPNMGGVPMAVSASMPGKPPSMTANVGMQQAAPPMGRGKSMSPVMMKKQQSGQPVLNPPTHLTMPGVSGAGSIAGLPKGVTPQQMQQMQQMQQAMRLRQRQAQQAQQAQLRTQAAGGGMAGGPHVHMIMQQQAQRQSQGGQQQDGQGKTGGADQPMVID